MENKFYQKTYTAMDRLSEQEIKKDWVWVTKTKLKF